MSLLPFNGFFLFFKFLIYFFISCFSLSFGIFFPINFGQLLLFLLHQCIFFLFFLFVFFIVHDWYSLWSSTDRCWRISSVRRDRTFITISILDRWLLNLSGSVCSYTSLWRIDWLLLRPFFSRWHCTRRSLI